MTFSSPDELDECVAIVARELAAAELHSPAEKLLRIRGAAWPTSSEWLGELGLAIRELRAAHRVPPLTDAKLERIMVAVRTAWPNL